MITGRWNHMLETVVGIVCTVLAGVAGWVIHLGHRVATLEANRVNDSARLERIEDKLDTLLERKAAR